MFRISVMECRMHVGRIGVALLMVGLAGLAVAQDANKPADLKGAYTFKDGGWTYIHLEGSPHEIGFQHGYLLKDEIEDNLDVYRAESVHLYGSNWQFFREAGKNVLWPKVEPEYRAELQGIVDGMHARGSKVDLWDIMALNGQQEISGYYLPKVNEAKGKASAPAAKAPGKCSAFIATGSATKGGKIVIAHSDWSPYAEGERWTVVYDIVPEHGLRILMEGTPGIITSQDD